MNPLSLKDLLKGCLLVAFFENLPVLLFLIKRAALGNMKANFHCAHLHNLSPQGTGDVPTALSIVFTTPSVPLVGDRNGAQTATLYGWRTIRGLRHAANCSFLCGMNRIDTLFRMFAACSMLKGCLLDACCLLELLFEGTADKMDGALRNLLILSSYSP